jgi:hypothetical protein
MTTVSGLFAEVSKQLFEAQLKRSQTTTLVSITEVSKQLIDTHSQRSQNNCLRLKDFQSQSDRSWFLVLCCYLVCRLLTSNWQLTRKYRYIDMATINFGVNPSFQKNSATNQVRPRPHHFTQFATFVHQFSCIRPYRLTTCMIGATQISVSVISYIALSITITLGCDLQEFTQFLLFCLQFCIN